MKKLIIVGIVWIVFSCWLLFESWAQTNTNAPTIVTTPGSLTITPVVGPAATIVPLQDKIAVWTDAIQNLIIGAGTIVTALLLLWGRIWQLKASVVPTLVKSVETHGTPELKNAIEQAALRAGVEPALNAAVKANTTASVSDGLTSEPLPLKPVTLPVVEAPKPDDTKPL